MAVAVKNAPETTSRIPASRLAVASWAGVVYFLVAVGIVFYLIPWLWQGWVTPALAKATNPFVDGALRILVMVAAAAGLVYGGLRLAGPKSPYGLRAGIFLGLVDLFVVGVLTQWVGIALEALCYEHRWLGANAPTAGGALTGVVGLALLFYGVRLFFRPTFEKRVLQVEEQGWFTAAPYKGRQGQMVRRGTMVGLLVLVACGIITMLGHGTLTTWGNWSPYVPFTGKVALDTLGDVPAALRVKGLTLETGPTLGGLTAAGLAEELPEARLRFNRFELRDFNAQVFDGLVKVDDPGDSSFKAGQLVEQGRFSDEVLRLKEADKTEPTSKPPDQAAGVVTYQTITLLPHLVYTLPLLLGLAGLWLSYRVVHYPVFADFLIATEAELNKVSWTSRRRLKQDTIVVLVTVILLTLVLFLADQFWVFVLTRLHVLRVDTSGQESAGPREQPW